LIVESAVELDVEFEVLEVGSGVGELFGAVVAAGVAVGDVDGKGDVDGEGDVDGSGVVDGKGEGSGVAVGVGVGVGAIGTSGSGASRMGK